MEKITDWLTLTDAAKKAGLSVSTLRYHIGLRRIDTEYRYGMVWIDPKELARFLKLPRKPGPKPKNGKRNG